MNTRIHLISSLVALLVLFSIQPIANAQFDTVAEFDQHFLHQYPEDSLMPYATDITYPCARLLLHFSNSGGLCSYLPTECAAVFYYPGTHYIYGIAAMIQDGYFKYRLDDYYDSIDSINWNEQLRIYAPNNLNTPLASGTITLTDCDRYMKYKGCVNTFEETNMPHDSSGYYVKLLQVEFDNPVVVKDTFVLSITHEYFRKAGYPVLETNCYTSYGISIVYKYGCTDAFSLVWYDDCIAEQYPTQHFMYKNEQGNWVDSTSNCVMQIFPIIDLPGDTCPAVSNVHITGAYGSLVMAEWETAQNNSRWEVSYGPVGTEPDSGTIITCMEPVAKMLNLNVDSQYVAYVRPVCRFGITKRGEWSEGVVFNPLSGEVGIEQVADTEPLTLYPNPASGTVRIGLPEGLQGVDVRLYDMAGREVMRSTSLTLDVSHLPQGTYTVRAATATGTRSGRLVVAER